VYIVQDIKAGEQFTEQNIRIIRPGDGAHPRFYEIIIGKKAGKDIAKGTPFQFDLLQ